jgi:hypothetical protein
MPDFIRKNIRDRGGGHAAAILRQLADSAQSWDDFCTAAESHGVSGLFFHDLTQLNLTDRLPESVRFRFENTCRQTAKNTLVMLARALEISQVSETSGIPVMAIQGLSLIKSYQHPGLRPMNDIDLMIPPDQHRAFLTLLRSRGYQAVPRHPHLLKKQGLVLDVHTHILNLDRINARRHLFPEDLTPMWARARPFFPGEKGLQQPEVYDNFTALAAHALKHSYSRLIWLADLHHLMRDWDRNHWAELIHRGKCWHQEKTILYALILIERIFRHPIPVWVLEDLGAGSLNFWEKHSLELKARGFSSDDLCMVLWLCNVKTVRKKLELLIETIFPEEPEMKRIFPRSPRHLNYIKRSLAAGERAVGNLGRIFRVCLKSH